MIAIWHNPRCSKSRQTLALIADHHPTVRKYLEDAPSIDEINHAIKLLDITAFELIRHSEKIFKELGLSKTSTHDELVLAMHSNPILIERPIVFANNGARVGRPPESVLDII